MSALMKEIGRYVDSLLAIGDEIVHVDAADAFIAQHSHLLDEYVADLVRRQIAQVIKSRTQVPAPPIGQGVLFTGFPAAVTVRDGVTKPIRRCTLADLLVGRQQKVDNIDAAKQALAAYEFDLDRIRPHMSEDDTTVEDVAVLIVLAS